MFGALPHLSGLPGLLSVQKASTRHFSKENFPHVGSGKLLHALPESSHTSGMYMYVQSTPLQQPNLNIVSLHSILPPQNCQGWRIHACLHVSLHIMGLRYLPSQLSLRPRPNIKHKHFATIIIILIHQRERLGSGPLPQISLPPRFPLLSDSGMKRDVSHSFCVPGSSQSGPTSRDMQPPNLLLTAIL